MLQNYYEIFKKCFLVTESRLWLYRTYHGNTISKGLNISLTSCQYFLRLHFRKHIREYLSIINSLHLVRITLWESLLDELFYSKKVYIWVDFCFQIVDGEVEAFSDRNISLAEDALEEREVSVAIPGVLPSPADDQISMDSVDVSDEVLGKSVGRESIHSVSRLIVEYGTDNEGQNWFFRIYFIFSSYFQLLFSIYTFVFYIYFYFLYILM